MWAMIGLVLCTLIMLFTGVSPSVPFWTNTYVLRYILKESSSKGNIDFQQWAAVYDLCAKTKGVKKNDSIADLATAYLGVRAPHIKISNDCLLTS